MLFTKVKDGGNTQHPSKSFQICPNCFYISYQDTTKDDSFGDDIRLFFFLFLIVEEMRPINEGYCGKSRILITEGMLG